MKAAAGTVYLVGAGPGDPGLVGVRARELVRQADCLVYDRLIPSELLREAPAGCELIDAGKRAGDHVLPQETTNNVLVERAQAGKRVVRLKGGDPFLFGRGGEEAEHCRRNRVPFHIVPAVTSALSVPACAGIPVTHRGVSNGVTIVTASAGPSGDADPDYGTLAQLDHTLVLLMGLRRVRHITSSLVAAGAPESRPAAVISRGATPHQRVVTGTLASLADRVEAASLPSPGIIVVGDVVNLRERLQWFDQLPLHGLSVAVTRARSQASSLARSLADFGAAVIEAPSLRVEPLDDAVLDEALEQLPSTRFVVVTSVNGANRLFERLAAAGRDSRALAGCVVAAIGDATVAACRRNGVEPDIVPQPGMRTAVGMLETLRGHPLFGERVLLIRAERGDERLPEGLRDSGCDVEVVPAYRTVAEPLDAATRAAIETCDLVTFASAATVENFVAAVGDSRPARMRAVAIGPVTATAATEAGFQVEATAHEPSVDSLLVAVLEAAESIRR